MRSLLMRCAIAVSVKNRMIHAEVGGTSSKYLSSGQLDVLKACAFVLMVLDHVNRGFFGGAQTWMASCGKLAFPIFAVIFAYNLANHCSTHARFIARTIVFGCIAQWPFMQLAGVGLINGYCVNILFVFLLAWAIRYSWNSGGAGLVVAPFLFVIGSLVATSASFSWAGLALILLLASWFKRGGLLLGVLSIAAMVSIAPSSWWVTPVAILVIAGVKESAVVARLNRFLPPYFLYIAYAGHLWLIVLLATFLS